MPSYVALLQYLQTRTSSLRLADLVIRKVTLRPLAEVDEGCYQPNCEVEFFLPSLGITGGIDFSTENGSLHPGQGYEVEIVLGDDKYHVGHWTERNETYWEVYDLLYECLERCLVNITLDELRAMTHEFIEVN